MQKLLAAPTAILTRPFKRTANPRDIQVTSAHEYSPPAKVIALLPSVLCAHADTTVAYMALSLTPAPNTSYHTHTSPNSPLTASTNTRTHGSTLHTYQTPLRTPHAPQITHHHAHTHSHTPATATRPALLLPCHSLFHCSQVPSHSLALARWTGLAPRCRAREQVPKPPERHELPPMTSSDAAPGEGTPVVDHLRRKSSRSISGFRMKFCCRLYTHTPSHTPSLLHCRCTCVGAVS